LILIISIVIFSRRRKSRKIRDSTMGPIYKRGSAFGFNRSSDNTSESKKKKKDSITVPIRSSELNLIKNESNMKLSEPDDIELNVKPTNHQSTERDPSKPRIPPKPMSTEPKLKVPVLVDVVIKETLGQGKYGLVFLGIWNKVHTVALKKLKNDMNRNAFEREAEVLYSLTINPCPNIVRFLGIFEQYMVLEYCELGSLSQFLKKKEVRDSLQLVEMFEMALGICNGMVFLEERKILHRDLSVRNCLLTRREDHYIVKVSDFGLSRMIQGNDLNRTSFLDNPIPIRWTAPECYQFGNMSLASDVWSFGIVFWEIFTFARMPYDWIGSPAEVMDLVPKGEKLKKPQNCPDLFWECIDPCFKLNPSERPTFAVLFENLINLVPQISSQMMKRMRPLPSIPADNIYYNSVDLKYNNA